MGITRPEIHPARQMRTNFLLGKLEKLYRNSRLEEPLEDLSRPDIKGKILVIAPHPDDEVIGCGGLILKSIKDNAEVSVLFLTREAEKSIVQSPSIDGESPRILESYAAKEVLGYHTADYLNFDEMTLIRDQEKLTERIEEYVCCVYPDLMIIPNFSDFHPDHRAACMASVRAMCNITESAKDCSLENVLLYEVWGPCRVNSFFPLSAEFIAKKKEGLACYKSQLDSVEYERIMAFIHKKRADTIQAGNRDLSSNKEDMWVEGYHFLKNKSDITGYLKNIQNGNKHSSINI